MTADDTALLFESNSWEETFGLTEGGLSAVKRWFDQCRLTVNISKTKCLPIYIRAHCNPVNLEIAQVRNLSETVTLFISTIDLVLYRLSLLFCLIRSSHGPVANEDGQNKA
ncbi:hypothetical protein J6590_068851 [Homalodisca vitripennis]|nr:hypothetical protein J6590_068851 [Homalodisca vitripennis]